MHMQKLVLFFQGPKIIRFYNFSRERKCFKDHILLSANISINLHCITNHIHKSDG